MSQQFCLKWNNHMNNMMDVFKSLLSTESMVDVTLACDGLSLKAHKMVLSACSPFFQALFLENPCQHPIVILKDMKYTELKAIIEFMYHGEVNVAQDQLSALMKTAETLRVKGLAEVTNEKNQSATQEDSRSSHTDAPSPHSKRRKVRNRKRSLSGSDYSDSEREPKIKQPTSPDIEELSGDMSMDASSGQFSNVRQSRVPMQSHSSNSYHKTSSVASSQDLHMDAGGSENESDFGTEPAKLLQQSLTTEDARRNRLSTMSTSSEPQRRPKSNIDHSMGMSIVPTSLPSDDNSQQPQSPPDIKPELLELDPPMSPVAGPSHSSSENAMVVYGDPGPSNYQDDSALVSQDSQQQELYSCEVCDRIFVTPTALSAHKARHRSSDDPKKHRCHICTYSTKYSSHLRKHIFTHTGEKPFKCSECPAGFTQNSLLRKHMLKHAVKAVVYKCDRCYETFTDEQALQKHAKSHKKENKKYRCFYCSKRFSKSSALKKHERKHNKDNSPDVENHSKKKISGIIKPIGDSESESVNQTKNDSSDTESKSFSPIRDHETSPKKSHKKSEVTQEPRTVSFESNEIMSPSTSIVEHSMPNLDALISEYKNNQLEEEDNVANKEIKSSSDEENLSESEALNLVTKK